MKLSEALILRVDLQKKMRAIEARIMKNAKFQEGEAPSENPYDLIEEFNSCNKEWETLVQRINKTNSSTELKDGLTITDLIAKKDALKHKIAVMQKLSEAATVIFDRYSRSEIKHKSSISVPEIQKKINELSKEYRELDTYLQGINWSIDLI